MHQTNIMLILCH